MCHDRSPINTSFFCVKNSPMNRRPRFFGLVISISRHNHIHTGIRKQLYRKIQFKCFRLQFIIRVVPKKRKERSNFSLTFADADGFDFI